MNSMHPPSKMVGRSKPSIFSRIISALVAMVLGALLIALVVSCFDSAPAQAQPQPRLTFSKQQQLDDGTYHFATWIVRDEWTRTDYFVVCGEGCAVTPLGK